MKTNRRDFLKAAAGSAATAGVLTLAPSYAVASDEGEPFAKDTMVNFMIQLYVLAVRPALLHAMKQTL